MTKVQLVVFSVSPRETERYYLRIMLLHIRGAISFEELRTVHNTVYPTFKQAAEALGLVEDDNMWMTCMAEASSYQMPHSLFICNSLGLLQSR